LKILILSLLLSSCIYRQGPRLEPTVSMPAYPCEYEDEYFYRFMVEIVRPLNVRDFPSTEGKIVDQLPTGYIMEVYGVEGDWYQIYKNGYVSRHFVRRLVH